jgi:hypothetical protein
MHTRASEILVFVCCLVGVVIYANFMYHLAGWTFLGDFLARFGFFKKKLR